MEVILYYSIFISLFFLISRGGGELFFSKKVAYIISFVVFFIFLVIFLVEVKARFKVKKIAIILSVSFVFSSLLSAFFSYLNGVDLIYLSYMVYPSYISLFFIFFMSIEFRHFEKDKYKISISLLVYILFCFALLQQFKVVELPGSTPLYDFPINLDRPSSLTGSYLHYPLIMVVLGCLLYSASGVINIPVLLAFGSVFIAFSRSGMMLVILIYSFYIVGRLFRIKLSFNYKHYLKMIVFMVALLCISIVFSDFIIKIWLRLTSSFDIHGVGNSERVEAWINGLNLAFDGNFIFGDDFGVVTNLTGNLFGVESTIVESGLLQTIINFGLFGLIVFYSLLIYVFFKVKLRLEKCFLLAFILQSAIYQSTEVLPFITCAFLLGSISSNINRKNLSRNV